MLIAKSKNLVRMCRRRNEGPALSEEYGGKSQFSICFARLQRKTGQIYCSKGKISELTPDIFFLKEVNRC